MTIYALIVACILILNSRMIMIYKIFQDMNKKDLKECHNLNIILFNCKIAMIYSPLFFTQIDYIKNTILMLGFILNSIVFNEYEQINQCYELNVIMNFMMQLKRGLRKMHRDWDIKSSSLHSFLISLDIWNNYIKMQWLYINIIIDQISLSYLFIIRNEMRSFQIFSLILS